ncbi:MAG: hypothetical protein VKJ02_10515, partial [Snowella sp.]|nr:hypothetical protein [Snowella sp.]
VLGMFLPNLNEEPNANTSRQNVGVIELTEAEQSRLPDTNPAPPIPPVPDGTSFPNSTTMLSGTMSPNDFLAANPNVKLPPITETPLPALPSTNYSSNFNALPGQLPPLPPLPALPPYPSNLPPLSSYNNLNNIPIARAPVSLPPLPSSNRSSEQRPVLPPLPGTQSYFRSIEGDGNNTAPRPNFGVLPPPRGTDFITRASQDNGVPNLPGMAPQPELQPDGEDTNPQQATVNDLQWRAKLAKQNNGVISTGDIESVAITGAYPRAACRSRAEARVIYNVEPSGEVTPIQTSRYSIFNQLARQSFQSQRFNKPTRVSVDFNYDPKVCESAIAAPNRPTETAPVLPSLPNNSATVSPVNDPTRSVPQLPTLTPGSNRPPQLPETDNNAVKTAPPTQSAPSDSSPERSPSPATPQSNPAAIKNPVPVTPPKPNNTDDQEPASAVIKNPQPQATPEVKPESAPEAKPENPAEVKAAPDNKPVESNSAAPVKPQSEAKPSVTPTPEVKPSPAANRNLSESKRSRLLPKQSAPKAEPPAVKPAQPEPEAKTPVMGPPLPGGNDSPLAPSMGKKE